MMRRSVAPSSSRRVIRSAAKTVSASFISSEGWRRNWPKPTHRLEPCDVDPETGHQDDEEKEEGDPEQERAQPAELAVVEAHRQRRTR